MTIDYVSLPYIVEPMHVENIEEVLQIEREAFSLPWSVNAYHHDLTKNEMAHYVVLRQHLATVAAPPANPWQIFWRKVAGKKTLLPSPILGYGGFWLMVGEAHISTIAVRREWRGKHLGELLLVAMIELAIDLKGEVVTLEVRVSNTTAQNLYRKYGFTQVGRRKRYYSDNGEDAYIMTSESLHDPAFQQRYAQLKTRLWQLLRSETH